MRRPPSDCYAAGDDYGAITYPASRPETRNSAEHARQTEPYIFHFPDGNASIARLLVRSARARLIPGHTMDDIVTARDRLQPSDHRIASAHPPQQHSCSRQPRRTGAHREGRRDRLRPRRQAPIVRAKELRARLLQRDDSVYLPGTPGKAERRALIFGERRRSSTRTSPFLTGLAFHKLGVHQIVSPGSFHWFHRA